MKNKKYNNNVPDERQMQITSKSILAAFIFLVVCLVAAMIYNIVTTGGAGYEGLVLIGACVVIIIANHVQGDVGEPMDIFNRPLPTGDSKEDRKARKISYVLESVSIALGFAVMDVLLFVFGEIEMDDMDITEILFPNLSKSAAVAITAVITFVIVFAVGYVVEYFVEEKYRLKRYNKMIAELDADDDE